MMDKEDIAVLDFEASGLCLRQSYPIEVGIAGQDLEWGTLIYPDRDWTYWNEDSYKIHGIPRALLVDKGEPVKQVAIELNHRMQGRVAISDNDDYEICWADRLFDKAGVDRGFEILSLFDLLDKFQTQIFENRRDLIANSTGIEHRAQADAKMLYECCLYALNFPGQGRVCTHL